MRPILSPITALQLAFFTYTSPPINPQASGARHHHSSVLSCAHDWTTATVSLRFAPFQRVLRAAARLVNDLKPVDHVTSALKDQKDLHCLSIKQSVEYKLCSLVHNVSVRHADYLNFAE